MSAQKVKAMTYRVENIPFGTTKEQLVGNYFYVKDQAHITVKSLVPSIETIEGEDGDLTATIMFYPHEPIPDGLRVRDDSITVGKDFRGFTPLYVPPADKGPIVADVIAVTGLAGHAFDSWSHSEAHMWLRDYLPKDAPNARILTYGSNSVNILQDHTNKFVHSLIDMREEGQCDSRPIIFIGYSLGCLIIKKTLTDAISLGISRIPVREIIFLGAPHRGLNITALQTLVNGEATEQMVLELKSESPTLTWLNQGFTRFARDIDILTCYETKPTKKAINVDGVWVREGPPVMMVSRDSAQLFYPREKLVSADCDHSQIAKIRRGQSGIYPAIKAAVKHGLVSTANFVAGEGAATKESSRLDSKFQNLHIGLDQSSPPPYPPGNLNHSKSKESAVEPVTELPLSFTTVPNLVQEPLITPEAPLASTTMTNLKDSSSPCKSESKGPDVSIASPIQPQEQNGPSDDAIVSEADVTSLSEEKESTHLAELDDDLKVMFREFNEEMKEIRQYAQNRALLDLQDRLGFTPLQVAEHLGLREATALLIASGALLETRNCIEHTSLHTAANSNRIKIIPIILDDGANIKIESGKYVSTALYLAAVYSMHHILALLLRRGAEIDALNDYGTPLLGAINDPQCRKCVEVLLDAGANVNYKGGGDLETPLIRACRINNHEAARIVVDLLLRNGAAVDLTDSEGYTPLMMAARMGHLGACQSLLEKSPQLDIKTPQLRSENAIYFAATNGHEDVLDLLIAKGASCIPPKAVSGQFTQLLKWNLLRFSPQVTPESQKRIQSKLRAGMRS
ncbi:hypothetical protein V494_02544 [Pseudogymnoascus sp. VKM F-4513 (FW-928)]|nr:hypothetical protein V494_02544 [Pseudogymnoascus sp. VKM F-4513 (FW-928)]